MTLNSNGSFTYTPPANWTGTTTFTYRAKDTSNAYSNTATVTITVKEPVAAADDHYEVRAGSTLVVEAPGVLANDRDPTGGTLTAHWVPGSGPHYGTLDYFSPTGAFRYRPNADFAGSDSFRYVARNSAGDESEAIVYIWVLMLARDDAFEGFKNQPLVISPPGILANDILVLEGGERWGAPTVTSWPHVGTLEFNEWGGGGFTYRPPEGWAGQTSFTYKLWFEDWNESNEATVTITIHNRPPSAQFDSYIVRAESVLTVDAPGILANDSDLDGDILVAQRGTPVIGPSHGTLRTFNPDGSFVYEPEPGYAGGDYFEYVARDSSGAESRSYVLIYVQPKANDDTYTSFKNVSLVVSPPGILANDILVWEPLDAFVLSYPHAGTLEWPLQDWDYWPNRGGFTYRPPANWTGQTQFIYQVFIEGGGDEGASNSAKVTITVLNRDPIANIDSYITLKNTRLSVASPGVLENDADPDPSPEYLMAELVSGPAQGTLNFRSDGSFDYDPPAGWIGSTSFTYRVVDTSGASSQATVIITVQNQDPTAQNDGYTTYKNTPLSVGVPGVLANDSDPDGDALTAELVSGPTQGTLTLNPNGSFTYTPPANWTGTTTFIYRAMDTSGAYSNTAWVTITVQNRAPIARDDTYFAPRAGSAPLHVERPGVLGNDEDPDPHPESIRAQLVSGPPAGQLVLREDGSFIWTPPGWIAPGGLT
ncbi:MAG: Ig-like domain-containing protein, partial [Candidatus Bipolaricaulota bacterium]|nr:Ig-like domain-containing protein [Candidatus Bipolaricaulota bacterium]